MTVSTLALDYDGTIAVHNVLVLHRLARHLQYKNVLGAGEFRQREESGVNYYVNRDNRATFAIVGEDLLVTSTPAAMRNGTYSPMSANGAAPALSAAADASMPK